MNKSHQKYSSLISIPQNIHKFRINTKQIDENAKSIDHCKIDTEQIDECVQADSTEFEEDGELTFKPTNTRFRRSRNVTLKCVINLNKPSDTSRNENGDYSFGD